MERNDYSKNQDDSLNLAAHQKNPVREPRLSTSMKDFIATTLNDTPEEILKKPVLTIPLDEEQLDDNYPLTHYFISSSHNTYLLSRQLLGVSSVAAYTNILLRGCACVEIDLWWRSSSATPTHPESGLVVTHGYTLSSSVSFLSVCKAIASAALTLQTRYPPPGPAFPPILISLENHVPAGKQEYVIDVLKRELGEWLVVGKLDGVDDEEGRVKLRDFRGRVVVMVEYHPGDAVVAATVDKGVEGLRELSSGGASDVPETEWDSDAEIELSSGSSDEGEREGETHGTTWPIHRKKKSEGDGKGKKKKAPHPKITQALAELGYYCRSMKPGEGWWEKYIHDPKHILINISESKHEPLLSLPPLNTATTGSYRARASLTPLQSHSLTHLRRVYPRGTRIRSGNMLPSKYWRSGTQVVGVNWQKCDAGGAIGGALFAVDVNGGSHAPSAEAEEGEKKAIGIESLADTPPILPSEYGRSYVLKPAWLRGGGEEDKHRVRTIKVVVWGGAGIIPPEGYEAKEGEGKQGKEFGVYLHAELHCARPSAHTLGSLSPDQVLETNSSTVKTRENEPSVGCDFVFNSEQDKGRSEWAWEYLEDGLAFLRIAVYRDERWGRDDLLGWFCARTVYLPQGAGGWRIVRLMDEEGRYFGGSLLVRFEFIDL